MNLKIFLLINIKDLKMLIYVMKKKKLLFSIQIKMKLKKILNFIFFKFNILII